MFVLAYITCSSEKEAKKIASTLVSENLVACANFFPITSVFEWQGETKNEGEFLVLAKTTQDSFRSVKKRVLQIHSYDVPAILALPLVDGNKEFLTWVAEQTQDSEGAP